jgi:hypothetical protein
MILTGKILLKSTRKLFQIERKSVSFIKFIFEAYDGLAIITTLDPYAAKIALYIAPGCELETERLLDELKRKILIRPLDEQLANIC